MTIHYAIEFEDMPSWCAGTKVSGLYNYSIVGLTNKDLINAAFDACGSVACLVASVNVEEVKVIAWLKKNGWKQGPLIKNWGHDGRGTRLYFKQVTKARYNRGSDNF